MKCIVNEQFKTSFHKALNGYDAGLSNPFSESGDPGIKGRIFDIHCSEASGGGARDGHYNFVRLETDRHCDSRFKTNVVTSSKEYSEEIGSSNEVNQFTCSTSSLPLAHLNVLLGGIKIMIGYIFFFFLVDGKFRTKGWNRYQ